MSADQRLLLGQLAVDGKSNEITAVPKLLDLLSPKGRIVTADALNCQRAIAAKVVAQGGDYVLALKGNQGSLHDDVRTFLDDLARPVEIFHTAVDGDHGRIETRTSLVSSDIAWLQDQHGWPGLRAIGKVVRTREIGTQTSTETAYYLLSAALVQGCGSVACCWRWGYFPFMPFKHNAARRHRIPRARYRVTNWPAYEASLRRRGDLTLWLDEAALAGWAAPKRSSPGGQPRYSELAIELVLTLRLVFHLALRQAEAFSRSVLGLLGLALPVPDHTTLSRRGQAFAGRQPRVLASADPIHLVLDSTGLELFGQGEWDAEKHGRTRRSWRKLVWGFLCQAVIGVPSCTALKK